MIGISVSSCPITLPGRAKASSTQPGRETILIDAIVAGALTGDLPFDLVGYVEATPGGGSRVASVQDLAWDLRRNWPQ